MIYEPSLMAVIFFVTIVLGVLGISWYFAGKTRSSQSYFAAGGTIHWGINGIAFAGDYLSAASFLGICGMIATAGYDGFLYSIGYLAGWVVALFVVAEPMKRLGKYTFTDALDAKFNSKGIQLMAAISTLVVSLCYLIPQMVGAGVLIKPLLGIDRVWGIIGVGAIVIIIVATAGMKSTTYVQFIKGGLLIVFSLILSGLILFRGFSTDPGEDYHKYQSRLVSETASGLVIENPQNGETIIKTIKAGDLSFVKTLSSQGSIWWVVNSQKGQLILDEALSLEKTNDGKVLYNGAPMEDRKFYNVGHLNEIIMDKKAVQATGPLDIFSFFRILIDSSITRFVDKSFTTDDAKVTVWYPVVTAGEELMRPGIKFKVDKGSDFWSKLNFISLMMALFFGTAALPHVLIRYYTVPSPKDARKSTIVAIGAIGLFYVLTLFMGLGAAASGVLDVESSNMAAPLLARSFGVVLFSLVSAVAFATILGTVSGLIVAASGAVAHDLMDRYMGIKLTDDQKVMAGKIAAIIVGLIAIVLGILFMGMNVSFLVGLAFAVAASANLPAIMMLLFWKRTTARGIAASIGVGIISSLTIILLSPSMFERYGMAGMAPIPLDNPGVISIPLSFITLVLVSLMTPKKLEVKK
ncbi:MAG: cation acetate symporter [Spirochaetales bacterium]|nr:cation acetate symporter [Spirochaetales bacterium]